MMRLDEFIQLGGTVHVAGQLLEITPRQLRFLFATGAIAAGRHAGRLALGKSDTVSAARQGEGSRHRLRSAILQGVKQHVAYYKEKKTQSLKDMTKFPSTLERMIQGGAKGRTNVAAWTRRNARGASRIGAGLKRLPWQAPARTFDPKKLLFKVGR